jgi:5-methylcytosine-specific restriction endonuclease McrA
MGEPLISRCTRTVDLDVYHLRRDGDNSLDNAQVLCRRCHAATKGYELPGRRPPAFDQATKDAALSRAADQCECTRIGACHGTGRPLQAGDTPVPGAPLR